MTHELKFDDANNELLVVLSGDVTGEEIIALNGALARYPDHVYHLWNFLGASKLTVSVEQMHEIARMDRSSGYTSRTKKVAVVGDRRLLDGVYEMYELFSREWVGRPNGYLSRRFENMDSAYAWIRSDP